MNKENKRKVLCFKMPADMTVEDAEEFGEHMLTLAKLIQKIVSPNAMKPEVTIIEQSYEKEIGE